MAQARGCELTSGLAPRRGDPSAGATPLSLAGNAVKPGTYRTLNRSRKPKADGSEGSRGVLQRELGAIAAAVWQPLTESRERHPGPRARAHAPNKHRSRDPLPPHRRPNHQPPQLLVRQIHPPFRNRRDPQPLVLPLQRQPPRAQLPRNDQPNLRRHAPLARLTPPLGSPFPIQPPLHHRRMNFPRLPRPPLGIIEPAI